MSTHQDDIAWRIGGPQGSGVDTAAGIFARAAATGGLHVHGRREYYSNIMGRHSYFDVRVASAPLRSHRSHVDLLTALDAETLARHAVNVSERGAILYDERCADVDLGELPFLDKAVNELLTERLAQRQLPASTRGLLQLAAERGVHTFQVPYKSLMRELAQSVGVGAATAERTLNTLAVSLASALLGYPAECVRAGIRATFADRPKVIGLNDAAVDLAFTFAHDHLRANGGDWDLSLSPLPETDREERLLITGSQATALGKLAGGLTFQTYYPISPATDESLFIEAHCKLPLRSGDVGDVVVVQTEDELAAVTMAIGAALTGARCATATSGPGFSLMAEGLGWAGINEVPVVITLYQRGGPSTGLPTRTEQGDLEFALHAGHGEFGRIVLASGDIEEAFTDAAEAFNYAERYQLPVIHLLDKALASTTLSLCALPVEAVSIDRGARYSPTPGEPAAQQTYVRFGQTPSGISTRAVLGQPGGEHWLTGGEHTEEGRVTEDPTERERQMEKRARKFAAAGDEIPQTEAVKLYGAENAPVTILSWGSTKGALLEAIERLDKVGLACRLAHIRLLAPFPGRAVEAVAAQTDRIVVVELNHTGQFARLLRRETGIEVDHLIVKYNGRPFAGDEVYRALSHVCSGDAPDRLVIRNPFE